ncbi:glycoside hydrolase family 88 protein [Flagellimonas myxillae]|uniref:glycoside hydrolase family 88 protein n=1 Tax=Flagellimonas myxillae TaxID=2942214 RepID=UPI00201FB116|nr:glycoside hydrolase family 88 protein [Muricauda myxillae]MCL6266287.1 glycoside hydrolase family 88 protein [Muricauda myxillae]
MKHSQLLTVFVLCSLAVSCGKKQNSIDADALIAKTEKQLNLLLGEAEKANRIPRTLNAEREIHWTMESFDWTEGFFPGSCWYLYQHTQNDLWKKSAEKFQAQYESHKYSINNHDLGFIFNCSYGHGYKLTQNPSFKEVMITAADSLITRFNPEVGCIKSWDVDRGWQSQRGWKFPVIVDNMMNLELLFEVSKLTNNSKYADIAIRHANTTLKNHFRTDNSSYHVVDYDPETGEVRSKQTAQGHSHESSWARGQAWGLYGFTLCYRYTQNPAYLELAEKIARFIVEHKNLPDDKIPYWDFDAPSIPEEPRDASAAAIMVSALLELDSYSEQSYTSTIEQMLSSLASPSYTSGDGENKGFVLDHSVGSIPHGAEIDVPLNYADYYYLEALSRYKNQY